MQRRWLKLLVLVMCVTSALMLVPERPMAAPPKESDTDLALILAVDASSSIDEVEFAIQLGGIASAFRDAAVIEAIRSGRVGRIDVMLLLWSGEIEQSIRSEWTRISGESDALGFASHVETFERRVRGATSVGNAIMASVALLRARVDGASRLSIDLSGDGKENIAPGFPDTPNRPIAAVWHGRSRRNSTSQLTPWQSRPIRGTLPAGMVAMLSPLTGS